MSLTQLVQFYAPLAGLLIMAFWTGALSQRVRTLEREAKETRELDSVRTDHDRIIRIETSTAAMTTDLARIGRQVEGFQRQLANLMQTGGVREMSIGGAGNEP